MPTHPPETLRTPHPPETLRRLSGLISDLRSPISDRRAGAHEPEALRNDDDDVAEVLELRDPTTLAHRAYRDALESAGGVFMGGGRWRPAFAAVGRAAAEVAGQGGGDVGVLLEGWAGRYVAERRKRRPDWWAEHVAMWLGSGEGTPASNRRAELDRRFAKLDEAETRVRSEVDDADEHDRQLAAIEDQRRELRKAYRALEGA